MIVSIPRVDLPTPVGPKSNIRGWGRTFKSEHKPGLISKKIHCNWTKIKVNIIKCLVLMEQLLICLKVVKFLQGRLSIWTTGNVGKRSSNWFVDVPLLLSSSGTSLGRVILSRVLTRDELSSMLSLKRYTINV